MMDFLRGILADPNIRRALVAVVMAVAAYVVQAIAGGPIPAP